MCLDLSIWSKIGHFWKVAHLAAENNLKMRLLDPAKKFSASKKKIPVPEIFQKSFRSEAFRELIYLAISFFWNSIPKISRFLPGIYDFFGNFQKITKKWKMSKSFRFHPINDDFLKKVIFWTFLRLYWQTNATNFQKSCV